MFINTSKYQKGIKFYKRLDPVKIKQLLTKDSKTSRWKTFEEGHIQKNTL